MILRVFKAVDPPRTPCILRSPAPVLTSKARPPAVLSELTVAVELKVTVVAAASASIVTSPSRVTGPVIEIAPAVVEVVMSPLSLTAVSPTRVTDFILLVEPAAAPILPPTVIVPVPVPSVSVNVSVTFVPITFPVIVMLPPVLSIEKSPLIVTLPRKLASPPEVVKVC